MTNESCGSCRFFLRESSKVMIGATVVSSSENTMCRRHPPLAVLHSNGMAQGFYPPVSEQNWCGDWRSKDGAHLKTLEEWGRKVGDKE